MTATSIAPTRTRLRAVNAPPPTVPYTWTWLRSPDGLWTLVVRVTATRQQLRISYRIETCPGDAVGERIAARLYSLARREQS